MMATSARRRRRARQGRDAAGDHRPHRQAGQGAAGRRRAGEGATGLVGAGATRADLELERQQPLAPRSIRASRRSSRRIEPRPGARRRAGRAGGRRGRRANVAVLKAQQQEAARTLKELKTAPRQGRARSVVHGDPCAGRRRRRQPRHAGRRLRAIGPAARQSRAAGRRLCGRQLQGDPARRLHPGQTVEIRSTPSRASIDRHVDSFSPATGSEFALLPIENATGNFTKIIQRVPVRIRVARGSAGLCGPACRSRSRSIPRRRFAQAATGTLTTAAADTGAGSSDPAASATPAIAGTEPKVDRTILLLGFAGMVIGQFMAILDIQIVAASLPRSRPVVGAADEISWIQTAYLIPEVVMIPLSGYLSRRWARVRCSPSRRRLHAGERHVRPVDLDRRHDRLPRRPGLRRRRHDPDRLRLGLRSSRRSGWAQRHHRADRHAGAHRRPDAGRSSDRLAQLALAVLHQRRARRRRPGRGATLIDFDKGATRACRRASTGWAWALDDGLPRLSMQYVLEAGPRNDWFGDDTVTVAGLAVSAVSCGDASSSACLTARQPIVDLTAFTQPQFRGRLAVLVRARHRPLRSHLSLSRLSRRRCAATTP